MIGAAIGAAVVLVVALVRFDRWREDQRLSDVRRELEHGSLFARQAGQPVVRTPAQVAVRQRDPSLLERLDARLKTWHRRMLLAPLPIGVVLLAVDRVTAGIVFLGGLPLALLYLLIVTRRSWGEIE